MDPSEDFSSVRWDVPAHDPPTQSEFDHEENAFHSTAPPSYTTEAAPYIISSPSNTQEQESQGETSGYNNGTGREEYRPGHGRNESVGTMKGMVQTELEIEVHEPVKELEGTKDMFVSYLVSAKTSLKHFSSHTTSARRRFQDFVFLREYLSKDFPACVVPPLPDKHRMEYFTGDRFSQEFIERRRQDLQVFLTRLARHPTLSRSNLLQGFLESTEWNVLMHTYISKSQRTDSPERSSLLDNISDTILNAFTKVRKPDERFIEIKESFEKFQEVLQGVERNVGKGKTRTIDLSADYEDFAGGIQGLGYLESGITDPLHRFENALLDFSTVIRDHTVRSNEDLLHSLSSLLQYSNSFTSVLKLRDQKQLDFEDLSAYLSQVTSERDRLAGGYGYGVGLAGYFKDKIEAIREGGEDRGREGRMRKLDGKIKELSDAVTTAQDTLDSFNDEVLAEHGAFQMAKRFELKDMLGDFADSQIEMYKKSIEDWDR